MLDFFWGPEHKYIGTDLVCACCIKRPNPLWTSARGDEVFDEVFKFNHVVQSTANTTLLDLFGAFQVNAYVPSAEIHVHAKIGPPYSWSP